MWVVEEREEGCGREGSPRGEVETLTLVSSVEGGEEGKRDT